MACQQLEPDTLSRRVDAASLGFASTAELSGQPLPWIGQSRAETAARFGLDMDMPGYNLLVVGEAGTGRTTSCGSSCSTMLPRARYRPIFVFCTMSSKLASPGPCACLQGRDGSCASACCS